MLGIIKFIILALWYSGVDILDISGIILCLRKLLQFIPFWSHWVQLGYPRKRDFNTGPSNFMIIDTFGLM